MANKTIAQLDSISDSIDNIEDLAILYDTSATKTVKTTIQNLLTTQLSGLNTSGKNVINAINEVYSKINETISEIASEEDSPASSNHNPGELILYNGNLYRTISYIVTGESLIDIGDSANIENITISECIKELYDTQVLLGNETIETDANTITGAINQHEGYITALDSKVGTDTLDTTAQDLSAAINQHEDDITTLNSNLSDMFKTVEYEQIVGSIEVNKIIITNINIAQTGYTPIGVLKIQNNHGSMISTRAWVVTNNTMTIYSYSTTAFSDTKILVGVAYVKSSFMAS